MTDFQALAAEWETRKELLAYFQDKYADAPDVESEVQVKTLETLLACLHEFGQKQIDFFLALFQTSASSATLPHPLYSPEYVFDVTQNQIGHDLDLFLRAGQQRLLPIAPQNQVAADFRFTLQTADRIAWASLEPAISSKLIAPATVFVYYEKSHSVRLIPYAPVALVGIPFGANGMERDLATIVHEIGHYVASRRIQSPPTDPCTPAGTIDKLAQRPPILTQRGALGAEPVRTAAALALSGWEEEIFADVYACLVGGPMTGFTMLDAMRRLPATRWMEDDGKHPLPLLRPRIYAATLRAMAGHAGQDLADQLCAAACELDQATDGWLGGSLPPWLVFRPRTGAPLRLTWALELITEAVHRLVDGEWVDGEWVDGELATLRPQGDKPNLLWTQAPFVMANTLRSIQTVADGLSATPPPLEAKQVAAQTHASVSDSSWQIGATGLEWDWELARDGDVDAIARLEQAGWNPWWLAVLSAGFWTTEGPGAGNPQPPS